MVEKRYSLTTQENTMLTILLIINYILSTGERLCVTVSIPSLVLKVEIYLTRVINYFLYLYTIMITCTSIGHYLLR